MSRKFQQSFRVPKKTNGKILEVLIEKSDQKQFLQQKLIDSFRKPEISKANLQFIQFWSIKNPTSESNYAKRRQSLKLNNQSVTEYFGFYFIKSELELSKLSAHGQIKIGNVPDSKLATGSMGVSLSQFSDIFHPGDDKYIMPNNGILLIIKYLKGKINYVQYDDVPTDPQPGFNCHIVRNFAQFDINPTLKKAFHSTQVFLYEYSDDIDIIEYPTQLVMIGAVKFTSTRKCIFRAITNKPEVMKPTAKRLPDANISDTFPSDKFNMSKHIYTRFVKPNNKNALVNLFHGDLIVGVADSQKVKINVTLMTKFREPIQLHSLKTVCWNLSGVIPNDNFLEFLKYTNEQGTEQMLKISQTKITQIHPKFFEGKFITLERKPKYVMYLKMTPNSFVDKKNLQRLCDILTSSSSVGYVNIISLPRVLFYVIPGGNISDKLGLPGDHSTYLHVLLLFSVHPEIQCSNIFYKEEYNFVLLTNIYCFQHDTEKKPLVVYEQLKKTVLDQSTLLKALYNKLLRRPLSSSISTNKIPDDNSDMDIDSDVESETSNKGVPSKRRKLSGVNSQSPLVNGNILKVPVNKPIDKDFRQNNTLLQNHYHLPEIPIRTPVSLPDIICFDQPSLEWAHLTKPIPESADIESSSISIKDVISKPLTLPNNESQSHSQIQLSSTLQSHVQTKTIHQNQSPVQVSGNSILQKQTQNVEVSRIPDVVQIHNKQVINCLNPKAGMTNPQQFPGGELNPQRTIHYFNNVVINPTLEYLNNQSPHNSQISPPSNPIHNTTNPSISNMVSRALLPTPVLASFRNAEIIPEDSSRLHGHFRPITLSRNTFRRPRTKVVGAIRIRNTALLPEYNFVSIYKE